MAGSGVREAQDPRTPSAGCVLPLTLQLHVPGMRNAVRVLTEGQLQVLGVGQSYRCMWLVVFS